MVLYPIAFLTAFGPQNQGEVDTALNDVAVISQKLPGRAHAGIVSVQNSLTVALKACRLSAVDAPCEPKGLTLSP